MGDMGGIRVTRGMRGMYGREVRAVKRYKII